MTVSDSAIPSPDIAVPENILIAAQRINAELDRRSSRPMTLSPEARQRLELVHAEFLADVGREAVRIARRNRVTTVDQSHVDEANQRIGLGAGSSAFGNVANSLGGLLAGAGIESTYAIMFTNGPHSQGETLTAIVLSVLGAALLAVGLTVTFGRRR